MKIYLKYTAISALLVSGALHGQTLDNGSFETDSFTNSPGYISGNSAITGWTASDNDRVGLNDSSGPFVNGTIPGGSNTAFIQVVTGSTTNTLTSASGITGLTIGQTYRITYAASARLGTDPEMGLIVGGTKVIQNKVNAVGASNPYRAVSYDFVATSSSVSLAIDSTLTDGTDKTLLVDNFTVSAVTPRITKNAWNGDATSGITTADGRIYTHAYNLGGGSDTTVNGVTFTAAPGNNPAVAGQFSYNMGTTTSDSNNVTGSSADLASNFVFNNSDASLVLDGLVDGQTYLLSLFTVGFDSVGYGRAATITGSDGELLTVDINEFGNDNGLRVDFEYVANGTSETFNLRSLADGSTFHTYAFANAAIPESSSFALLAGFIGLGCVMVRRRVA